VKSLLLAFFLLLTTPLYALDDFDLAKYGPDSRIDINRTGFVVKLILYRTQEELDVAYEHITDTKLEEGKGIRGFATVSIEDDVCFVHLIPAQFWDDRESLTIMGHEIYHCALASHKDMETEEEESYDSLYEQDRQLELEWLREDYEDMGIKIDEY